MARSWCGLPCLKKSATSLDNPPAVVYNGPMTIEQIMEELARRATGGVDWPRRGEYDPCRMKGYVRGLREALALLRTHVEDQ